MAMPFRTKTLALAVGGIVALSGVTLFFWKRSHPPPPAPIRAEAPVADASTPMDAGLPDAKPAPAQTAAVPEVPLSPECAALRKTNEEVVRKYEKREKRSCHVEPPDVGCVTAPDGVTWGYRIAKIYAEPEVADDGRKNDFPCDRDYDLEIVRRDRTGTKVVSQRNERVAYDHLTKLNVLALDALTDYDGDGEIEILRTHDQAAAEAAESSEATLLTFKDGKLTPYPPAAGLHFGGRRDIDGDGRLDLLSGGPFLERNPPSL